MLLLSVSKYVKKTYPIFGLRSCGEIVEFASLSSNPSVPVSRRVISWPVKSERSSEFLNGTSVLVGVFLSQDRNVAQLFDVEGLESFPMRITYVSWWTKRRSK